MWRMHLYFLWVYVIFPALVSVNFEIFFVYKQKLLFECISTWQSFQNCIFVSNPEGLTLNFPLNQQILQMDNEK